MRMKKSPGERLFDALNGLFMIALVIATLYPFVYVLMASFSEPGRLMAHRGILLWPAGFSWESYKLVFDNEMIKVGYFNTLFYVIAGTFLNIVMTSLGAYTLSRRNVMLATPVMLLVTFTMFFSGGLIPSYLLMHDLHLLDTRWALVIPGAISTWNLIIMRTSFQGVPVSLEESARIDGANDWTILFRIVLPLSLPVLAVMVLFYAVAHWNGYFGAMIYLRDRELFPLQLVLREILLTNSVESMTSSVSGIDKYFISETIKYATIMVATLPILFLYPFLQKYFVKGVMIGAIKE
ncbi:carbohydrate ABC transporter permease [Paenibacillus sp. MBLB4367]|uniref:carbohydrate ABC transporter permease n=1 Tax=Paenibacillus sp. MBLB4367 TaxID=3384767 RepID=UPI003907EC4F